MEYKDLLHEIIIEHLRKRLSREYKEISVNRDGEKKAEYKGHYPDLILGNHGIVLAVVDVETADSISAQQAERWKSLAELDVKLVLMIPKEMKMKVTDLLWAKGLMDRVSIGTYEISINMP